MKTTDLEITTDWDALCTPRICGLLAEHPTSFSRVLQNSGFRELKIPFSYHAFSVTSPEVPISAMREMGFRGFSVTIPYKEKIIPLLDTICPVAKKIAAVNTVINSGKALYGINTDWFGIIEAFKEIREDFFNDSCLILGAGGAAKAALYAMQQLKVRDITLVNRTHIKAEMLASNFSVRSLPADQLSSALLKNYTIIINTTPGTPLEWFPYDALSASHLVLEMVNTETHLSKCCISSGACLIYGIRMLFHQGLEQFSLFTENRPPKEVMEKALLNEFQKQR